MKNNISRISDHLIVSTLVNYFGYQMKSDKTQMLSSMVRYTLSVALQSLIGFFFFFFDRERVVNFHSTWVRPKEITSD